MTVREGQGEAAGCRGAPRSVAVVGGGLALWLTALALSRKLPDSVAVTAVETRPEPLDDALYGTVLPPEAYALHLDLGIAEPELVQEVETGFAFGTTYLDWAETDRSWVSAFHAPLPVVAGVPLAKLVAAQDSVDLGNCLLSAAAARRGVFAHPPESGDTPLSSAEYGYLADPRDLARLYRSRCTGRVRMLGGSLADIERESGRVSALRIDDGTRVEADLWVDASGLDASLLGQPEGDFAPIGASLGEAPSPPGPPTAIVQSDEAGWSVSTPLRTRTLRTRVGAPAMGDAFTFAPAIHPAPWTGNAVAVGTAAACLHPLTVAAMRLLLRDVRRLLDLFPVGPDTHVEAGAYNAACTRAAEEAHHYQLAHFADVALPSGPVWDGVAARLAPDTRPSALARKLRQYAERGYLVDYDFEPFDADSWAILHAGLGRRPRRADALAATVPAPEAAAHLRRLAGEVEAVVAKMPPHPVYLAKFLDYLRRRAPREAAIG